MSKIQKKANSILNITYISSLGHLDLSKIGFDYGQYEVPGAEVLLLALFLHQPSKH